jgi:hypothetical protein
MRPAQYAADHRLHMNTEMRPDEQPRRPMRSKASLVSELVVAYFIHGVRAIDGSLRNPALQARPVPVATRLPSSVATKEHR